MVDEKYLKFSSRGTKRSRGDETRPFRSGLPTPENRGPPKGETAPEKFPGARRLLHDGSELPLGRPNSLEFANPSSLPTLFQVPAPSSSQPSRACQPFFKCQPFESASPFSSANPSSLPALFQVPAPSSSPTLFQVPALEMRGEEGTGCSRSFDLRSHDPAKERETVEFPIGQKTTPRSGKALRRNRQKDHTGNGKSDFFSASHSSGGKPDRKRAKKLVY